MSPVCSCGSSDFTEGFCDNCGKPEPAAANALPPAPAAGGGTTATARGTAATARGTALSAIGSYARTTNRTGSARRPTPPSQHSPASGSVASGTHGTGSRGTGTGSGTRGTGTHGSRGSRGSSTRRRALGGGLVQMPVMPSTDPVARVLRDPRVPCPNCRAKVNPYKKFCTACGTEYHLRPTLNAGDTVAGQYQIQGPIAFGGLGWIYLAMDSKLNRWVVLKGLLNARDEAAARAAVAERQFLAAVKHGKIVGVYNFVQHGTESFIVMEYVGGRTWKELRREGGPMRVEEAIAYTLGILPAFSYLHSQGLVYCDFKPDNAMAEGDDVKLIDMGGVRRMGDPDGDVYGTVGYMAPEASNDPTDLGDIFTIGRTLLALVLDFDNTRKYRYTMPPPDEFMLVLTDAQLQSAGLAGTPLVATQADGSPLPGWLGFESDDLPGGGKRWMFSGTSTGDAAVAVRVTAPGVPGAVLNLELVLPFAGNESLYRLLRKATAQAPEERFQSVDEFGAQLLGVLREIVARHQPIHGQDSAEFMTEHEMPGTSPLAAGDAWRRLPEVRADREDVASAEVFNAMMVLDPARRADLMMQVVDARPDSAEARLRMADLIIEGGAEVPDRDAVAMALLDAAQGLDPEDWRPSWFCGLLHLGQGRAGDAIEVLDRVYDAIPGELAPKLALGVALEAEGRLAEAAGLFELVARTDPGLTGAAFGLARCRSALGDLDGAVAALERVPASAATHADAQLQAVRLLAAGDNAQVGASQLSHASSMLMTMSRQDIARHQAEADLAMAAVRLIEGTTNPGALLSVLGEPPQARALRGRARKALLTCARMAGSRTERWRFVDLAHAVAPVRAF